MVRQGIKWICIAIVIIFIALGARTAVLYGQQHTLLLLWAIAIPLSAVTWYLFTRVCEGERKKKKLKEIFTLKSYAVIGVASLAVACEVIYSSFS